MTAISKGRSHEIGILPYNAFKQSESVEVTSMNRAELKRFIFENYNVESDFPWLKYPNYEVFRHSNNQKWFALIMDIPKNKLGLQGSDLLDVVNLKCDTLLIGSLRCEPGFSQHIT